MSDKNPPVDEWARLHFSYHDDTDLSLIADTLDDEHGMGFLPYLYWPRMIARAKQARSFGWFSTTPRSLAVSIHDNLAWGGSWSARARMWELLVEFDMIRVDPGPVENPSTKLDVLIVEWEKWQSTSAKERQRLARERKRVAAGEEPHWTVRHWSEFAFRPLVTDCDIEAVSCDAVTENRDTAPVSRDRVTTLEEKREEEKEGARDRALPPAVTETIELVREIPGLSRWQLESNVRKAMAQYPSLPDAYVCEAITAFESRIPEGKTIHSGKAWQSLRNCFEIARRRLDEGSRAAATPIGGSAPIALLEEFRALRDGGTPA